MKILITGSEGLLMQQVIPKLQNMNHNIVGIDNLYRHQQPSDNEYEFFQLDLLNFDKIEPLFKNVDVVIHAAAKLYGVGGMSKFCADILGDDISATRNVLAAAAKHKINRFVYISSSMVYESYVQDLNNPLTEDLTDNNLMPKNDYGLSKIVGERLCQSYKQQYDLNYTIWRPFNILTPLEKADLIQGVSHVFSDFINNILIKKLNPLPIIGDGNQIRCFTWIDDVAKIIADWSFSNLTIGQAYNICNVEPISMRHLAEKIYAYRKLDGPLEFLTTQTFKNDVLIRFPSVAKLISVIGEYSWQSVDTSLEKCIQRISTEC